MKIEEYVWLSLVFVFVFSVHTVIGLWIGQTHELKANYVDQTELELFRNIRLKKAVV